MKNYICFLVFLLALFVLIHRDSRAQWVQTSKLPSADDNVVTSIEVSGNIVLASTVSGDGYGSYGDIFLSTDNGDNWTSISSGLKNTQIHCIDVTPKGSGTDIFVGVRGGVYHSTDNGKTWLGANGGFPNDLLVISLKALGSNILAATPEGLFLSTNKATSWLKVNPGLPNYVFAKSFAVSGSTLFAGGNGVYFSSDSGKTWAKSDSGLPDNPTIYALSVSGSNLFAGTFYDKGVYLSTDNGSNWSAVNNGLSNKNTRTVEVYGTNIFTGNDAGVFISADNGAHWVSTGYGNWVGVLAASDTYLFAAGGEYGSVYKRPLSELITDVESSPNTFPSEFSLDQNYPNPFNPTTTIEYSIPTSTFVTLKVYDILGNEVAALVNEKKSAGQYTVQFDAGEKNLASGIYFYQLTSKDFSSTKKLILLQ